MEYIQACKKIIVNFLVLFLCVISLLRNTRYYITINNNIISYYNFISSYFFSSYVIM